MKRELNLNQSLDSNFNMKIIFMNIIPKEFFCSFLKFGKY